MFDEDFHLFREAENQIRHETQYFFGRKPVRSVQLDLFEPEEMCGEFVLENKKEEEKGWGRKCQK